MNAYSNLYISKAQVSLGTMLHYAVYDLKMDLGRFYSMFLSSGIADAFGSGDPKYTVGMSGIELARSVLHSVMGEYTDTAPNFYDNRTPEYWTGWALAYYEWCTDTPFVRIEQCVPITEILGMYHPYHEADISKFVDTMDRKMQERNKTSRLARLRAYVNLSQKALAERSGVSVRMIEQYEQGRKDINHASSTTVYQLSKALGCKMEDLME